MRLPPDIEGRDIRLWLSGCWFRAGDRVVRYTDTNGKDLLAWDPVKGNDPKRIRLDTVEVCWPHCGAINIPAVGALYVQRLPKKQYRRSYQARSVTLNVPARWDLHRNFDNSELWDLDPDEPRVVKALFDPEYPSFDEALRMLREDGLPTVALNRNVIFASLAEELTAVYYQCEKVGKIVDHEYCADASKRIERRVRRLIGGSSS